jgi:hypothetical protein
METSGITTISDEISSEKGSHSVQATLGSGGVFSYSKLLQTVQKYIFIVVLISFTHWCGIYGIMRA